MSIPLSEGRSVSVIRQERYNSAYEKIRHAKREIPWTIPHGVELTSRDIVHASLEEQIFIKLVDSRKKELIRGEYGNRGEARIITRVLDQMSKGDVKLQQLVGKTLEAAETKKFDNKHWKKLTIEATKILDLTDEAQRGVNSTKTKDELPVVDRIALTNLVRDRVAALSSLLALNAAASGEVLGQFGGGAPEISKAIIQSLSSFTNMSADELVEILSATFVDINARALSTYRDKTEMFAKVEQFVQAHGFSSITPRLLGMQSLEGTQYADTVDPDLLGERQRYFWANSLWYFQQGEQFQAYLPWLGKAKGYAAEVVAGKAGSCGSRLVYALDLGTGFSPDESVGHLQAVPAATLKMPNVKWTLTDALAKSLQEIEPIARKQNYRLMQLDLAKVEELPKANNTTGKYDIISASLVTHQLTYKQRERLFHNVMDNLEEGGTFTLVGVAEGAINAEPFTLAFNLKDPEGIDPRKVPDVWIYKIRNNEYKYDVLIPIATDLPENPIYHVQTFRKVTMTQSEITDYFSERFSYDELIRRERAVSRRPVRA